MPEKMNDTAPLPDSRRSLRADCERCFGLCCVAPAFSASADFAINKDAGHACRNLQSDFRCAIHADLREKGFPGCAVYDCFGAGQQVSQVTFSGQDWRQTPAIATPMFTVFSIMRQLHELLWYLAEALTLHPARSLHGELSLACEETRRHTYHNPGELAKLDVTAHRQHVDTLLLRASNLVRAEAPRPQLDHRRADLIGRNFSGADLRGANLRGAYLLGADLRDTDLRMADLIGVDLRGADVSGADLSESLFLTQFQINATKGDAGTKLPPSLTRPTQWASRNGPSREATGGDRPPATRRDPEQ